jgi:hypothetical protein
MATPTPNQQLEALFSESQQNAFQSQGLTAAYVYLGFGVPTVDGYTFLINNNDATDFGAGAGGPVFNQENVYINAFVNLITGNTTAAANFATTLGGATTLTAALTAVYNSMVPTVDQTAAGRTFFLSEASFYEARAAQVGLTTLVGQAAVGAAALANILVNSNIPGLGQEINQFTNAVANGSAAVPQSGNFTPILTAIGPVIGETFTLTPGIDNVTSTGAFDVVLGTITGPAASSTTSTLNPGDQIAMNGGTVKIVDTNGTSEANELAGVNITGPFQFVVQNVTAGQGYDFTALGTVQSVTSNNSTASATFTNIAAATTVNATGASSSGGGLLTQFSFTAANANGPATIGFGNISGANIHDVGGTPTALTINSTVASNGGTGSGKADTFTGTGAGTLAAVTVNAATNFIGGFTNSGDFAAAGATLTVSGLATAVDLTQGGVQGVYTTVNASGLTGGGLTLFSDAFLTSYVGGAGGNNSLLDAFTAGLQISAGATSIAAGGGTDNILASSLINTANIGIFSGWNILDVTNNTNSGHNIDAALLTGDTITGININSTDLGTAATTVQHLAANATINLAGQGEVDAGLTVTHVAGGPNTLAVTFADASASAGINDLVALTSSTDATVSIVSGGTAPTTLNVIGAFAETDNVTTSITITGANQFFLDSVETNIGATAGAPTTVASSLTLIDGTADTGGLFIDAGTSSTFNNVTTTYTGLKIEGGTGLDQITNNATSGVVVEQNHINDVITLGGAGGSGTFGTGTGDTGVANNTNQSFTWGSGATGVLDVIATAEVTTAGALAQTPEMTNVTGAVAGFTINMPTANATASASNETAAVTASHALSLIGALNADVTAFAAQGISYFIFSGQEYVVQSHAAETAISATDSIVHLVGGNFTALTATLGGSVGIH